MKKQFTILVLTVCLIILSAVFFSAYAAEIVGSGTCGKNLTWTLDDEGTLTISGTGKMEEFPNPYESIPWYDHQSTIEKIVINEGVTTTGNWCFAYCTALTTVELPESLTTIGSKAFYDCPQLKEIELPANIETVQSSAFSKSGLTQITLKEGVTSIGIDAFRSCASLISIDIPSTLTYIGSNAFKDCTALKAVYITDLESWCKLDIRQDTANPLYYAHYLYLNGEEIGDLVIPDTITTIPQYLFIGCYNIESVTIPKTVTSIGNSAFHKCAFLKEVHISDLESWCKTSIYNHVSNPLYNAKYLYLDGEKITDLKIPETVTTIPKYAFYNAIFESVTIPKGLTSIGPDAFICRTLKNVYISDLEAWCKINFETHGSNPLYSKGKFHLNEKEITELVIPDTVTSIPPYSFVGGQFTKITFPVDTVSIGRGAFYGCDKLEDVIIPEKVTTIDDEVFHSCSNLKTVTLPAGIESIGKSVFFSNPSVLSDVYYKGTEAQWNVIEIASNAFFSTNPTIHFQGGMSGETMLDKDRNEVPIPKDALIVAIFRKNATGAEIEKENYGINFEGTNFPGEIKVQKDGIWVIKLVDPDKNLLTKGKTYNYSVYTNGKTIEENLTYTIQ